MIDSIIEKKSLLKQSSKKLELDEKYVKRNSWKLKGDKKEFSLKFERDDAKKIKSFGWDYFKIIVGGIYTVLGLVGFFFGNIGMEVIFLWIIFVPIMIWGFRNINDKNEKYRKAITDINIESKNLNEALKNIPQTKTTIEKTVDELNKLEKQYSQKLQSHFTNNFDKNNNGELDIIEDSNDYIKLLQENQDIIIDISEKMGEDYIHTLVKIDDKLNTKKQSLNLLLQKIFQYNDGFDEENNIEVFEKGLKAEIHSYNILLANSLYMVSSLISNDRITFRKIYEKFDKLNIFNSHYENQSLSLLRDLNQNLRQMIVAIGDLNQNVTSAIEDLTYVTEQNTRMLSEQLNSINSGINVSNLISAVNTYQTYKIKDSLKIKE